MATPVNQIRKRNIISYEGKPCIVLDCVIKTPPNLRPHCQMQIRDLNSGKIHFLRLPTSESFDVLHSDVRKLEYLYEDQGVYSFMDPESFENYELDKVLVEEAVDYLVPNNEYEILFVNEKPITINLPSTVHMKVIDAPEGLRGDSSGNVLKPVTVETGLTVNVPLFIKNDEIIKVSTENGSYLGRA